MEWFEIQEDKEDVFLNEGRDLNKNSRMIRKFYLCYYWKTVKKERKRKDAGCKNPLAGNNETWSRNLTIFDISLAKYYGPIEKLKKVWNTYINV